MISKQRSLCFFRVLYCLKKSVYDPCVQNTALAVQNAVVSGVLHQGVLEQIGRLRWHAPPKQQSSLDKTFQRFFQYWFRLARHLNQHGVGKLPTNGCADLRYLLGRAKPIEASHQ